METRASKKRKVAADAPPSTLDSLPLEILDNIVGYLADDKYTLAQCMRVSSGFNSLVAPTLYREIKFDGSTHSIFQQGRAIKGRKTKALSFNLAQSKQIRYKYLFHKASRTWAHQIQTSQRTIKVPILYPTSPDGEGWYSEAICGCIRNIEPRKLVFKCNYRFIPSPHIVRGAKTAVYIFGHVGMVQPSSYSRLPHFPAIKKASVREIFVFWSSTPDFATKSPSNFPWRTNSWQLFERTLLYYLDMDRETPGDYTFVNIESVVSKLYHQSQRGPLSECEAAAAHFGQRVESLGGLSQVKITFTSMRDYLKKYDWAGEFTDEQVQPWLDLMKKEEEKEGRKRQEGQEDLS